MENTSSLISQLERDFQELKKEYTLFFSGVSNKEPYELKELVLTQSKSLRNSNNMRTVDQFRTNNLIAKVQTHIQLWERQLEKKYSGELNKRPKPKPSPKPAPKAAAPENKSVVISNAGEQRDKVVSLYDEYMRLNLLLGARKMINFTKFQNFIQSQTQKIRTSKQVANVKYEVLVQDQKWLSSRRLLKKQASFRSFSFSGLFQGILQQPVGIAQPVAGKGPVPR